MMSNIDKLMEDSGPSAMYDYEFKKIIEDNLALLFDNSEYIQLKPKVAYRNEGDLFSALREYNIPTQERWIMMRINGYDSPLQYKGELELARPSTMDVRRLLRAHRASKKLTRRRKT